MKIIGISSRRDWQNYEYLCAVSAGEMAALLDKSYRDGQMLSVGDEVKVEKLAERLKEIQHTKAALTTTPKKLRELADALEHECVAIVSPTPEPAKE